MKLIYKPTYSIFDCAELRNNLSLANWEGIIKAIIKPLIDVHNDYVVITKKTIYFSTQPVLFPFK